jgi:hypothetical protein
VEHLVERPGVRSVGFEVAVEEVRILPARCGPRDPRLEPRVLLTLRHPDGGILAQRNSRDQRDL